MLTDKADKFYKNCFAQKRKTLVNNLTSVGVDKAKLISALEQLGFAQNARAEELGTENLQKLETLLDS